MADNDQPQDQPQVSPPNPGETWQEYGARIQAEAAAKTRQEAPADDALNDPTFEGVIGGNVPKLDKPPETREDAAELGKAFAQFRAEVAQLRRELQQHRPGRVAVQEPTETIEDRTNARAEAIANHSHYCPGCGTLSKYPRICTGPDPRHPTHPPIEMGETEELGGDPENHTRAPSTDPDQPDLPVAA